MEISNKGKSFIPFAVCYKNITRTALEKQQQEKRWIVNVN